MSGADQPGGGLDIGDAVVDTDRERRQGIAEIIYGQGKTSAQVSAIATALLANATGPVLATRISPQVAESVMADASGATYDPLARLLVWRPAPAGDFTVAVASAGTSDLPVAAEAAAVARAIGLGVAEYVDIGVAGISRLLARSDDLAGADLVIVVAGMEGALASAVGGLVGVPVIAVPTSTGYGAALEGVTALLAMLSSCAAGITVVNIDSGFAAAMAAHRYRFALRRRTGSES